MKRRAFLGTVAASATALAGFTVVDGRTVPFGDAGDETDADGNRSDGAGDGSDDSSAPTLQDVSFEVLDSGCGSGAIAASTSVDEAAGEVTVEGTITGPNACYTAELREAVYGAETDSLWVDVVATHRDDAGVCAQCITEIRYRVTLPFEGGLPSRVAVTHDGELVCPVDGGAGGREAGPSTNNSTAGDSTDGGSTANASTADDTPV